MINVIKDNTIVKYFTKCKWCGSELEYKYSDVNFKKVPFTFAPVRSIMCPACNAETPAELKERENYNESDFYFNFKPDTPMFNNCCCEKGD